MNIETFSVSDWDAQFRAVFARRESPPSCPACHRSGFYGPRKSGDRSYRMCKFCGFYQEPGHNPVQLSAAIHNCAGWPQTSGAPYVWWVQASEERFKCPACGAEV